MTRRQRFPGPGDSGPRGKHSDRLAEAAMPPHQNTCLEQKTYGPRSARRGASSISSLPNASRTPATLGQRLCFPEAGFFLLKSRVLIPS